MPEKVHAISIAPAAIGGAIDAPSSKSYFQRAVAAALLADGKSMLEGNSLCDDTRAAIGVAEALGARITVDGGIVTVRGGLAPIRDEVSCGESGLCIRMFTPIAALVKGPVTLTAAGSLATRPLTMLVDPISALGARCVTTNGRAPIIVGGPLQGGIAAVDGSISSQSLTGLLMALPLAPNDSRLTVNGLTSRPYIEMTVSLLRDFGITVNWHDGDIFDIPGRQRYTPHRYRVEGDWSSAAALLAAGAVAGSVTVCGLNVDSAQADRAVLDIFRMAGAAVSVNGDAVTVSTGKPRPFVADLTDCPDLFPVLSALALTLPGTSRLIGVSRLRHKESDRAAVLIAEFAKLGAQITVQNDTLIVPGLDRRHSREQITISPREDHRIAMAAALAALHFGPIRIDHASCVDKSYPNFFSHLARLFLP
ncbi:MAG TPA: 3-phosphoshikimate 1-carboxyvinyltransferase [bacterium]|nr:3-phosphoshikimate 1-carboxyvinyltransferase [bacterium]